MPLSDSDREILLSCGIPEEKLPPKPCPAVELPSVVEFIFSRWPPVLICMGIVLLFLAIFAFHVYWRRAQKAEQDRSEILSSAEGFAVHITQHFLPSRAVDAYRFRGLRNKEATVSIKFDNLGLTLQDGRSVLDGVSGEFKHSRMAAIMGPSGAGKTTFMNVLCGKANYGSMCGSALFNDGKLDFGSLKAVMGFVPQDDVVHERLTVRENLLFAARLRSPPSMPSDHLNDIVEDVLNVLQVGHIQGSIVGSVEERGISGGQRKRVNIGIELAASPTLLFLDEPTSGLDSTSSLQIINSLGKMTQLRMTIIMVIHQPRYPLFTLFHDVLLLGPGGRTVYLGPSGDAKNYFEGLGFKMPACENPADWLMDILSGTVPNAQLADFKPSMLFDMWSKRSAQPVAAPYGRSLSRFEDHAVLVRSIDDEWAKIDADHSGALDEVELQHFMQSCCHHDVHKEVVRELMSRISSTGKHASKQDLVDFVVGLAAPASLDDAAAADKTSLTFNVIPEGAISDTQPLLSRPDDNFNLARVGFFGQFQIILTRRLVQFFRESKQRFLDVGLVTFCACGVGFMHSGAMATNEADLPSNLLIFYMGLALVSSTSCLRVFGADRPIFWRERSSGLNVLAFFGARWWGNAFDLATQCSIYSFVYFVFTRPPVDYMDYFIPCLLVTLASASWGYFISVIVPPASSMMATVIFVLLFCGILGDPRQMQPHSSSRAFLLVPSLTRWAIPMTLNATLEHAEDQSLCIHAGLKVVQRHYSEACSFGTLGHWEEGVAVLLATSCILTIAGYLGLRFANSSKTV